MSRAMARGGAGEEGMRPNAARWSLFSLGLRDVVGSQRTTASMIILRRTEDAAGRSFSSWSQHEATIRLLYVNLMKLSGWLSGALLQVADDCRRLSCCCPTG
jgi:hypothetical protein